MKNWLKIGEFSKKTGVSARALRLYEKKGLIQSHTKGENGYRYYQESQLELAKQIREFKSFGFSLQEVKDLISLGNSPDTLTSFLQQRIIQIQSEEKNLHLQKKQIESILSSLKKKNEVLTHKERNFIMNHFEKISIVVTGIHELAKTAQQIKNHLSKAQPDIRIHHWDGKSELPQKHTHIIVIQEKNLNQALVKDLNPDVIVIKNVSDHKKETEQAYLNLYNSITPEVATIFNADDRASLEIAKNKIMKKGKFYYYSKNSALQNQIERIGGLISDGEEIKIFGFNRNTEPININLKNIFNFDDEIALIASLAAVMDIGMKTEDITSAAF